MVATQVAERTDRGRLFHRERAQEWTALASALVLTLGTDNVIPLFNLWEQDGSDGASMEWRLFFMKSFVGQQTDLEHYSKF